MFRILTILGLMTCSKIMAQPTSLSSGEIYSELLKLSTCGRAMYMAAHPDDENTLMIAWLVKNQHVNTRYLALTRGDGGQNLIGAEQGSLVGLLRTQELLEARKIDGGDQLFTSAIDFGYSKKTDETFRIWDKNKLLEEVTLQIRKFKPDVIITRFPPDERAGHGHHSASAILAAEAFDLVENPGTYPDQVKNFGIWKVKRLLWNTYNRGFTNTPPEQGQYLSVNLGEFDPIRGESYAELAARARSKHRSQGFGTVPQHTERIDYMIHTKGDIANTSLFEGVDISWNRVSGGHVVAEKLNHIIEKFDFKAPQNSVKLLVELYKLMETLAPHPYKEEKLEECKTLIASCAGLYFEVNAKTSFATPGDSLGLSLLINKRSDQDVVFKSVQIKGASESFDWKGMSEVLLSNKGISKDFSIKIKNNAAVTQPYYLKTEPEKEGHYVIDQPHNLGRSYNTADLSAGFLFSVYGQDISFYQDIYHKFREPSRGEIYRFFEIRPPLSLNFDKEVYVLKGQESKQIKVIAKSHAATLNAEVKLRLPVGLTSKPSIQILAMDKIGQEQTLIFEVSGTPKTSEISLGVEALVNNKVYDFKIETIDYEHIKQINVFKKAEAKTLDLDTLLNSKPLAYVLGTGDKIPEALAEVGYNIDFLNESNIQNDLSKYPVILIGVRAYNTEDWLASNQSKLMDYVKNGGKLLIQYQTQAFYGVPKVSQMGPYPFEVGHERVTDQTAAVKIRQPHHPIFHHPFQINTHDFEGWVQERGLYFANTWSDAYQTPLAMSDEGELDLAGSLLTCDYGKGKFVFTGLSFFRQLPAGNIGAYRFFINLIEY